MKVIQQTVKYASVVGLQPLESNEKNPFNRRNIIILLLFGLFSTISANNFFFLANTIQEYTESFFVWMTMSITYIGFLTAILNLIDIYLMLENFEEIIAERKFPLLL